jgi:hypothetical protein
VTSDSTHSNGDFGTCMALRVQPRLAPIRRRASRPLLGAVGRASMGFSRAIGRAQAVRPVVGPSDLNTSTLRPPPGFWRNDDGDATTALGNDGVGATSASRSAAPSRLPVGSAAATTSSRRPASGVNGAAASVNAPVQRETATWTDRLIEPSVRPAGSTRSARPSQAVHVQRQQAPAEPFVSSGSARFDELRRMMAEGVTPDAQPGRASVRRDSPAERSVADSRVPSSQRSTAPSGRAAPASHAGQEAPTVPVIAYSESGRDATQAGPATAPGRFSERLLPESIGDSDAGRSTQRPMPQRLTPDVSARSVSDSTQTTGPSRSDRLRTRSQRSPAANDAPRSNAAPASPRQRSSDIVERSIQRRTASEASGRSPSRGPAPAVAPASRMEKLQAFLEERGDLPPSGDSVPSSSERRSQADNAVPSTRPGRDRTALPPVGSAPRSRPSGNDGVALNPDVVQRAPRSEPGRSEFTQSEPPPSLTSSNQADDTAQRALTAEDPRTEGADSKRIVGSAESLIEAPATGVQSQRMQLADRRMQRLISQDPLRSPAIDEARSQAVSALRERADESLNIDVQRSLSVAPPAAAPSANFLQSEITASSAPPSLTRIDPVTRLVPQLDGGTLRRVSLPRALSTTHRPQNAVGVHDGAIQRVVSPPQSQTAMASVMNLVAAGPVAMRPDRLEAEGRRADGSESGPGSAGRPDRLIPSVSTIQRHVRDSGSPDNRQSPVDRSQDTPAVASWGGPSLSVGVRPGDDTNFSGATSYSSVVQSPAARREQVRRQTASPLVRALHTVDDIAVAETAPSQARVGLPALPESGFRPGQNLQRSVDLASKSVDLVFNGASISDANAAMNEDAGVTVVRRPSEDLAERFLGQLAATVQRRPAPLPVSYQPMADVIASGQRVMLSTDGASRRALRSVGKVAATTNNVIHLDQAATSSPRVMDEVIAHELTHVAHPSAAPRFFDDIDDSPEERQAEAVARVMARSPLAPNASTVAPPATVGGAGPVARVQRRTARRDAESTSDGSASGPTISASALAASITQTQQPNDVQRQPSDVQRLDTGSVGSTGGSTSTTAPSTRTKQGGGTSTSSIGEQLQESDAAAEWFVDQLQRNFHRLVSDLEAQLIVELERRGGHHWRGL